MKKFFALLLFSMPGVGISTAQVPEGTASSKTDSNGNTTYYDRNGHKTGSSSTNNTGTTSYYNKQGHKPDPPKKQ
ncbi:MAG: hypothetical protein LBG19_04135 [Prevotellaceae bacterium]|nr:hypothetical protein [Prevotellaceae bacterium]